MNNIIYWKDLVELLKKGKNPKNTEIDFNNEMISWKIVRLLSKNNYKVPQELIDYDDENIDYSDIPSITDEQIEKIENKTSIIVNVDNEIAQWLNSKDIDYNKLINQWLHSVFDNVAKKQIEISD